MPAPLSSPDTFKLSQGGVQPLAHRISPGCDCVTSRVYDMCVGVHTGVSLRVAPRHGRIGSSWGRGLGIMDNLVVWNQRVGVGQGQRLKTTLPPEISRKRNTLQPLALPS